MSRVSSLLAFFMMILYPFVIWWGYGQIEPRFLAGLLLVVGVIRLPVMGASAAGRCWLAGTLLLSFIAVWGNDSLPLKLYPVLVNAAMLGVFAYSLFVPPSIVERLARMREPDLSAQSIGYTRRVTQVWCIFFAGNGALALVTALWASAATWSLYNGIIAYLLMALLFASEYRIRCNFKRRLDA
jgi:uncharacterized membrane protein